MRRPTRSPRRFKPHHDEYVPSLEALQGWNACESIPVLVKEVYGKGLGVVARRALPANRVVARYEFRVVLRARAPPGEYRVEVDRKHVGKLDGGSFGPPYGVVAQVGALLNEPSEDETPNCVRSDSEYWGPPSHRRGAFVLYTTRPVAPYEELTWDYGPTYGRRAYAHGGQ
jgi:hypothetical protein